MRKVMIGISALLLIGMAFYPHPAGGPPRVAVQAPSEPASPAVDTPLPSRPSAAVVAAARVLPQEPAGTAAASSSPVISTTDEGYIFTAALETIVSPGTTFTQKQSAWKRLMVSGKLDRAITEFEQMAANDPQAPACQSVLGQAYMKKCATTTDLREQAIFAMKADKSLETALGLDPNDWQARFTRAVGMSFWPAQLNKGQEVITQFQTLIQQQEAQASEPQFAQSYLRLGDEYTKRGDAESAHLVWQRGTTLFPKDEELRGRLASRQ